jgi:large subunit ribosomal protein L3
MKFTIGIKKEMTQVFSEDGSMHPVTVVDIGEAVVVGLRTKEKDGYNALVIGKGRQKKYTKAEEGQYKSIGFVPKKVTEYRTDSLEGIKVGDAVELDTKEGDKVIVTGTSKGKGFAGVVKRWGFKGGPKTHGQSDRQRAPGSIGSGTTPGRVYKGKRMAGRMGNERKTVKNLKVVKYNKEDGILYIKGAIPGAKNGYLFIQA